MYFGTPRWRLPDSIWKFHGKCDVTATGLFILYEILGYAEGQVICQDLSHGLVYKGSGNQTSPIKLKPIISIQGVITPKYKHRT